MTNPALDSLNLGSIANGAAIELFAKALAAIAANIADTDTSPTAAREIVLKFKIKPEQDRRAFNITTTSSYKLASVKEHVSRAYLGKDAEGNAYILDSDPRQELLFQPPPKDENLLTFEKQA